jgi:WD40 repeat protein
MTLAQALSYIRVSDVHFSPDGSKLVYVESSYLWDAQPHICLMDLVTHDARQLTPTTKSERSPQWSSDGKKLAFLSNRAGKTQVYVMDADGGAAMAVTDRTDRFKGRGRRGCVRSAGGVRNRGRSRRRRHSPRKGAYNIDMFTRLLEWYDRHLPGAALETQSGSIENQIHVLSIQLADLGLVRVGSCPGEDSN